MKPTAHDAAARRNLDNHNNLSDSGKTDEAARAAKSAAFPEDLQVVIRSWSILPDALKDGIVAMIQTASRTESQGVAGGE
jgi:hypothetical protein